MLDPGVVVVDVGRPPIDRTAPLLVLPDLATPLLERERGIGDHTVERGEAARAGVREGRVTKRVFADYPKVLYAVKHEVHPSDGGGREVLLLAVDLAEECPWIAAGASDMVDRSKQHPASSAGRVVDAFAFLRVEDLDHHSHDAAWRVELSSLLALGDVGESANQELGGIAEDVRGDGVVAEGHP